MTNITSPAGVFGYQMPLFFDPRRSSRLTLPNGLYYERLRQQAATGTKRRIEEQRHARLGPRKLVTN